MDRRLAGHGRKVVKKFVEGLPAFEVIQERLKRHTRTSKHRRTS
jgi:hypothetical protein